MPPPPPPPPNQRGPAFGAPAPGVSQWDQRQYQQPNAPFYPPAGYQSQYGGAYAGVGSRLGAFLIDGLIGALFTIPGLIVLFAGPRHITSCTVNGEPGRCEVPTGGTIAIAVLLYIIGFAVFLYLYSRLLGAGATWGQRTVGIRTVDAETGAPIGQGRAVGRYFAMILSGMFCYLGFLWAIWDPKKQTWHDKLVSSTVVKA